MNNDKIYLPIRYILMLRDDFREGCSLAGLKMDLRETINKNFTDQDRLEDYDYNLDRIFQKIVNMSLEEILYSCMEELFNKSVMVKVDYNE